MRWANDDHIDMDIDLLGLVNDFLEENDLPTSVFPGKTAFDTEIESILVEAGPQKDN